MAPRGGRAGAGPQEGIARRQKGDQGGAGDPSTSSKGHDTALEHYAGEDESWQGGDRLHIGKGAAAAPNHLRSQLNSSAPDFTPSAYPYGGYRAPAAVPFWSWTPPMQPVLPLWREYADEDGQIYYYNAKTGLTQWERPPELDLQKLVAPDAALPSAGTVDKPRDSSSSGVCLPAATEEADRVESKRGTASRDSGAGGGRGGASRSGRRRGGRPDDGAPKKKEGGEFGPPGCNLFVFHLPDDWNDDDLHEYFAPHGNIISAKVMKELGTGRSRGFGFVSYEDRVSAATAIKKMQGYKILGKRLKVEFKKGEQEGGKNEADEAGAEREEDADSRRAKKSYPDDERLIGYLRAISANNVVRTLKESESGSGVRGEIPNEEEGFMPTDS